MIIDTSRRSAEPSFTPVIDKRFAGQVISLMDQALITTLSLLVGCHQSTAQQVLSAHFCQRERGFLGQPLPAGGKYRIGRFVAQLTPCLIFAAVQGHLWLTLIYKECSLGVLSVPSAFALLKPVLIEHDLSTLAKSVGDQKQVACCCRSCSS